MLDDRNFQPYAEAEYRAVWPSVSTIRETEETGKKFPTLDEAGLKKWCVEGYVDPNTGRRVYGKDVLLSCLFNKRGFWIELFEYAGGMSDETVEAVGGRIPWDRSGFAYRIKRAWYDRISPKNVCTWLGALDEERAALTDDIGNLSAEGLKKWCHEGYENESGKRVYGKDVLTAAAESGDFWNEIDAYAERLGKISTKNAGGRFPRHPRMISDRLVGDGSQSITIADVFGKLGIPMPNPHRVRQSSKGFLSGAELRNWCLKGYKTRWGSEKILWKRILLDAFYSGTFWVEFERYAKSLGKLELAEIGGQIPCTPTGYETRVAEAGLLPGAKGTCLWFGALDEETASLADDVGFLSAKGLRKWCFEGYVDDSWKTVLGKDVLDWCYASRSFWNSLEKYVGGISSDERRNMGGKFPKHAKSLGERTVGHETSIEELYAWFWLRIPTTGAVDGGVENPDVPRTFEGPRASALPTTLTKEAKGRVRSFVRKILELADPDGKEPLGISIFQVRETAHGILVGCSNRRVSARLEKYRSYVDGTLAYEASEWLEKPLDFDWKDSRKTGANENNG